MQIKIIVTVDTSAGSMAIHSDPPLDPFAAAILLSQVTTQCLAAEQQQRALLINPHRPGGGLEANFSKTN